jgi:hypothetical protein
LEILGVILLAALIIASLGMTRFFGFSIGHILSSMLGVLIGGILGAVVGVIAWFQDMIRSATGTSPMHDWPVVVFLAGSGAGALLGLFMTERVIYGVQSRPVAWAMALAGFAIGAGACFALLLLVQEALWSEYVWMMLSPLALAALTVAGYSFKAARQKVITSCPPDLG